MYVCVCFGVEHHLPYVRSTSARHTAQRTRSSRTSPANDYEKNDKRNISPDVTTDGCIVRLSADLLSIVPTASLCDMRMLWRGYVMPLQARPHPQRAELFANMADVAQLCQMCASHFSVGQHRNPSCRAKYTSTPAYGVQIRVQGAQDAPRKNLPAFVGSKSNMRNRAVLKCSDGSTS